MSLTEPSLPHLFVSCAFNLAPAMPKFILHRIVRMNQNPGAENITAGLEAAAYLHWITCHEHDPKRFALLKPQLPELRKQVAEYFELAAQETDAHLELMAAAQEEGGEARGTRDFKAAVEKMPPGQATGVGVQFGYNWVLLYWKAPARGGKPWGYRVYRTDKKSAPVLVATVCEPEALLPEQPEGVKLHYYAAAFNGRGEGPPSAEIGLMLNAPDEKEPSRALPGSLDLKRGQASKAAFPKHELPIRRELGAAMLAFVQKLGATRLGNDEEDSVMRQVATEEYRQAVEKAAGQGIEVSLCWHTLASWTEDGRERIGYFSRALDCMRAETAAAPPAAPREKWSAVHTEADCLFEIGRVHFHEGAPDAARSFLSEALPLAQRADELRVAAGLDHDDRLEGRIAELLLQLPDVP